VSVGVYVEPASCTDVTVNVAAARLIGNRFETWQRPFRLVVQVAVVLPVHLPVTTAPARTASFPSCTAIVARARHRVAVSHTPDPSMSPTCNVDGGGGGDPLMGPVNRSTANDPPLPSPSPAGNTRIVYVPGTVGRTSSVSWRPMVQRSPAGHVLESSAKPDGPSSSASRSGDHAYMKQPRGGRSITHSNVPFNVTVAAMGASNSSAVMVNVLDHEPWFATVPVKRWCAGKGVEPVSPAARATAA